MPAIAAVLVTFCAVAPEVATAAAWTLTALGLVSAGAGIAALAATMQTQFPIATYTEQATYLLALLGYLNEARVKLGMAPIPIPSDTTPFQVAQLIRNATSEIAALAPTTTPTTPTTPPFTPSPAADMPTFNTQADLDTWFTQIQSWYYGGIMSEAIYGTYLAWYNSEATRLATTAPTTGPTTPTTTPVATAQMPTFSTLAELQAWYDELQTMASLGTIDYTYYTAAQTWYSTEYKRLEAINAVTITPPIVLPPTTTGIISGAAAAGAIAPVVNVNNNVIVDPNIIVNVPPATLPPISIVNEVQPAAVYNTVDLSGMVSALPLIGTGIASALLANAGSIQHAANLGRNSCFQSTGAAMLSNILQAAAPLALTVGLSNFGPFRDALDGIFTAAWDHVLGDPALKEPVTPDRAPEISRALFVDALEAGMTAHLISAVAESVAPLKSLGLDYMAAFLGDMAGFSKIGGAMMGAIESQALTVPFKYYINDKVRSFIPDVRALGGMATEYQLVDNATRSRLLQTTDGLDELYNANRSEFLKWGAYSGYTDAWLDKWFDLSFRQVSYFNMRSIATAGTYDEPFFIDALAHSGYSPTAIKMLLSFLKRMSVGDTTTMLKNESRYDYLDGFIDIDTYGADLSALGEPANVVEANEAAAEARRNRTMAKAKIQYMLTAISKQRLTLAEFQTELQNMAIDPPMIDLYLQQAALKVKADAVVYAYYQTDAGKTELDTIRRRRVRGDIDATTELNLLVGLELSQGLAKAYVDNDTSRIRDTVDAYYKSEAGKVDVNTLRRARIAGTLSENDELSQLLSLEMSQELAAAIVLNDTVRLTAKSAP